MCSRHGARHAAVDVWFSVSRGHLARTALRGLAVSYLGDFFLLTCLSSQASNAVIRSYFTKATNLHDFK